MRRRIAILLALALAVPAVFAPAPLVEAQAAAKVIRTGIEAADLAYDATRDVLYASVLSTDENHPNRVVTIDPATGQVLSSAALGAKPGSLAISADGSALFVGIDGAGTVAKFALPSLVPQWSHALGRPNDVNLVAADIAVMPGSNDTIAVSAMIPNPETQDIRPALLLIIDGGIARPSQTEGGNGTARLVWGDDPSELYSTTANPWDPYFLWHAVDASGVVTMDFSQHGGTSLAFNDGFIYGAWAVQNAEDHPPTLAYSHGGGATGVAIDVAGNALYHSYVDERNSLSGSIGRFNLDTLEFTGSSNVGSGRSTGLTFIGQQRLAYLEHGPTPILTGTVVLADLRGYGAAGEYTALNPTRILDTRAGVGRFGVIRPIGPGETIDVPIAGRGGTPSSGADTVVMNVTVTNPTAAGYLTVFPSDIERPLISTHNFSPGQTIANLVTMPIGEDGNVSVYNPFGSVDVIFDVAGFYATRQGPDGSRFNPMTPDRIYDSREPTANPLGADQTRTIRAFPVGTLVPEAVVLNVTITEPTAPSHLSVWPTGVERPTVSNLNFVAGQTIANQVIVRVGPNGQIDLYNYGGTTHVVVDLVGWYSDISGSDQGRFVPFNPYRAFDTREYSPLDPPGKMRHDDILILGDPTSRYLASLQNVTVTDTVGAGYITVYPFSDEQWEPPFASTLNYVTGTTVPNHAIVAHRPRVGYYNYGGQAHLIVDVFGAFLGS